MHPQENLHPKTETDYHHRVFEYYSDSKHDILRKFDFAIEELGFNSVDQDRPEGPPYDNDWMKGPWVIVVNYHWMDEVVQPGKIYIDMRMDQQPGDTRSTLMKKIGDQYYKNDQNLFYEPLCWYSRRVARQNINALKRSDRYYIVEQGGQNKVVMLSELSNPQSEDINIKRFATPSEITSYLIRHHGLDITKEHYSIIQNDIIGK